ncbi:hypothetical protein N658DRAFT_555843, partial [Parathielavia hyrcaniae]
MTSEQGTHKAWLNGRLHRKAQGHSLAESNILFTKKKEANLLRPRNRSIQTAFPSRFHSKEVKIGVPVATHFLQSTTSTTDRRDRNERQPNPDRARQEPKMAVYPPEDPSPPPPPEPGLGIVGVALAQESETDTIEQAQSATKQEKDAQKKRWPRWPKCLRWPSRKEGAREAKGETKRSIMGKFGELFKRSDKSKAENPYAQQPVSQSSPPPQYGQYNQSQYNDNRQIPQGPPSGLPTGPRPGGLAGRVAPGPSRTDTWESNRTSHTAPPGYSEQPGTSSPPPAYLGSPAALSGGTGPALSSNMASPALPSNRTSPSVGNGFSREKYGAQDGFGGNRFGSSSTSPYDRSDGLPSQRQGGYGGLDTESGGLFANYKPPRQQVADSSLGQADPFSGGPGQYRDPQQMTEEDELDWTKAEIVGTKVATNDVARRNISRLAAANEQFDAMNGQLVREWEMLKNAEKNINNSDGQAKVGGVNIDDLNAANTSMFNLAANSKARVMQRHEKKMTIQRQQQLAEQGISMEADQIGREWEAERQKTQGTKPKVLGGSAQKTDASRFQFEDDTGEQQALDDEYDGLVGQIEKESGKLLERAQFQEFMLTRQNKLIDDMAVRAETVSDHVVKNQSTSRGEGEDSARPAHSRPPAGDPQFFSARQALPLWARQDEIRRILRQKDVLVLVGETGSGKSTQVPQFLYQERWCQKRRVKVRALEGAQEVSVGGMIAITQPRRVAATTLAHRVSREAGTPLNGQKEGGSSNGIVSKGLVGYSNCSATHISGSTASSSSTRSTSG